MSTEPLIPALFVSSRIALAAGGGGVQLCTREYMEILRAAGFELTTIPYDFDRRLWTRLRRRLRPRPYSYLLPPGAVDAVECERQRTISRFVFLNQVSLAPLASGLRARMGEDTGQIVLLSHGLESVDYFHSLRRNRHASAADERRLSQQLLAESAHRRSIDHVFCLAPFEVEIERWLGARQIDWLPRTVPLGQNLDWRPDAHRVGCVSTVDHPPNEEGLVLFLEQLEKIMPERMRFRLVGGPAASGQALAQRFRSVDFLGPLDDASLRAEASSWSCFVHPIFCYAMGCSTKLAVALAWGLPVATTPAGARGYLWREGKLPIAETPDALARLSVALLAPETARAAQREIHAVARSSPTVADVAFRFRTALLPDGASAANGPSAT